MKTEVWPAYLFKKQNIHHPPVQDCINKLRILQSDLRGAPDQAENEYRKVLCLIQRNLPEYNALCNIPGITNLLHQYSDQLLQEKMQVVSSLIERLMMIEVQHPIYRPLPYDDLRLLAPAQAFHLLILGSIRNNMLFILHHRKSSSKK
ncbi:hypothetical protein HYZ98_03010 [Candidatus Peregrinibacteria bacterium]|nr:hypothetical protein [Candidatus Peregrinibacteria bacterium]